MTTTVHQPAPARSTFDFGAFTREDWDSVLGYVRKLDPNAVLFLHVNGAILSADRDGRGTATSDVSRTCSKPLALIGLITNRNERKIAESEHRIYPNDCPIARAKWGAASAAEPEASCACGQAGCPSCDVAPAQPVSAATLQHCAECTAVTTAFLCETCDARRNGAVLTAVSGKMCGKCGAVHAEVGSRCAYCAHNLALVIEELNRAVDAPVTDAGRESLAACRSRLAAAEARSAPRETATTRELAKAHPWECDE